MNQKTSLHVLMFTKLHYFFLVLQAGLDNNMMEPRAGGQVVLAILHFSKSMCTWLIKNEYSQNIVLTSHTLFWIKPSPV